jgi:small subunit ribosomal protein S1
MAQKKDSEQDVPTFDDGWWASVLAEAENRAGASAPLRTPKVEERIKSSMDWNRAMLLYQRDEIVSLPVIGYNRGGVLVEGDGLYGFVPCSHLVEMPVQAAEDCREECLTAYVGRTLRLKAIECVPDEGRMVFSERAARAEAGKRPELYSTLKAGQCTSGEVTNVTEFGVFVDLGGVEGLIHISELSWGRVAHPGQVLKIGQQVEVKVLEVAPERCRIALSLKRLYPNPWETAETRYKLDSVVPAVITDLVPFGAFARLEEGLEGLIHTSEIPLPPDGKVEDVVLPGQNVQVRILQVDPTRQRLSLSMRINH